MARVTGVSTTTPFNIVVDAGVVYLNYGVATDERMLGATRGGATFTVTQEFRSVEVDGVPGPIIGLTRIINLEVEIVARMLELSPENLLIAFPGATQEDYIPTPPGTGTATHQSIRRARNIQASDFLANVAIVGTVQGKADPIVCIIYNAMVSDNVELSTADDDESVLELHFHGHFDVSDLDNEPWEIRYPTVDIAAGLLIKAPSNGSTPQPASPEITQAAQTSTVAQPTSSTPPAMSSK
jgi:hypothetical protein